MGDEWVNIDLNATEEELEEVIFKSTVAGIKLNHADNLHFYVLQKLLTTKEGGTAHKMWQRVLEHIQQKD